MLLSVVGFCCFAVRRVGGALMSDDGDDAEDVKRKRGQTTRSHESNGIHERFSFKIHVVSLSKLYSILLVEHSVLL